MKRELGIARCGLACCLCSENDKCSGCNSDACPDKDWCKNRKCAIEKGISHCYECNEDCKKGLLNKIKPYALHCLPKDMVKKSSLTVLRQMRKMELFITVTV